MATKSTAKSTTSTESVKQITYLAAAVILWRLRDGGRVMGLRLTSNVLDLLGLLYALNASVSTWTVRAYAEPYPYLEAIPFSLLLLQMLLAFGMVLTVMEAAWRGDVAHHVGPSFVVAGLTIGPPARQQPRPPIWVAARSPTTAPGPSSATGWPSTLTRRIPSSSRNSASPIDPS